MNGIGDALIDTLFRAYETGRPRIRAVANWIGDVARPPRGVRLVADDGSVYTGVLMIDRNEPTLMVAIRVDGPVSASRPPHGRAPKPSRRRPDDPAT